MRVGVGVGVLVRVGVGVGVGAMQTPFIQVYPAGQELPQLPQLLSSFVKSTQTPSQRVSEVVQSPLASTNSLGII